MISNSINICIFAMSQGGKWLRRGTTTQRLATDTGRLSQACKFDHLQGACQRICTLLFLWSFLGSTSESSTQGKNERHAQKS